MFDTYKKDDAKKCLQVQNYNYTKIIFENIEIIFPCKLSHIKSIIILKILA